MFNLNGKTLALIGGALSLAGLLVNLESGKKQKEEFISDVEDSMETKWNELNAIDGPTETENDEF